MSNFSLVPPIRAGMWVRIRPVFPHTLPKGLSAGRQVEVIRAEHDVCVVQDHTGNEWLVDAVMLDPGHMVWIDGHWEPEESNA